MLTPFYIKLEVSSPILFIRSLVTGMLFIFLIIPKIVSADKKIQHLDSLKLHTPKDIAVTIFARDVPRARHMAFDDQGVLFLSQAQEGKVVALPDRDKNGKADQNVSIIVGHRAVT